MSIERTNRNELLPSLVDGNESPFPQYSEETLQQKSRELRVGLEDLMERIRRFSLEEHVLESFEEDFCMLISQYPLECLQRAVLMTDRDMFENNPGGDDGGDTESTSMESPNNNHLIYDDSSTATLRLPVHLACDNNAPISIIRALLEADVNNQSILIPDKWGDLPIHTACSRNHTEVIRLLLEADIHKKSIHVKDVHESLPLHMAARYNAPKQVIEMLLQHDPDRKTLFVEGVYGQYPLTVACRGNASAEMMQLLLDYDDDKKSVLNVDRTGRLPIHVYMLRNGDRQCLQLLLEGMIVGRIHRVGLDKWKGELRTMLACMKNSYERDFATSDKLDMIADEIQLFMLRAIVFELAIWKASCLLGVASAMQNQKLDITTISMKEILELAQGVANNSASFSQDTFKKERHVNSGAEIIIPGVLSFLEDEPVARILDDFQTAGYLVTTTTGGSGRED
ncbi:ankyrin repeat domain protein [Nitzschia inconspicua]|uniref:Ankyrin repeat domain protein n=1 Tax=Nitzschia inconspicua TaxID=303405 RepID=A0A9K3KJQ8_9STRA|nr:ankyrin repeat domain protein [Nitzschia inconspicua]